MQNVQPAFLTIRIEIVRMPLIQGASSEGEEAYCRYVTEPETQMQRDSTGVIAISRISRGEIRVNLHHIFLHGIRG